MHAPRERGLAGLTTHGSQLWSQSSKGIKGVPRKGDAFGSGPHRILNFGNGGSADLGAYTPADGPRASVNILYGSPTGVTASDQFWHMNRKGIAGRRTQRNAGFGGECC